MDWCFIASLSLLILSSLVSARTRYRKPLIHYPKDTQFWVSDFFVYGCANFLTQCPQSYKSARIATTILLANPAVKQQCLHCCVSVWRVVGPCARSARIATTILLANPAVKQQCLHCCVSAWRGSSSSSSSSAYVRPLLDIGLSHGTPLSTILGHSHPALASHPAKIIAPPSLRT
ncbi:hypothetical protein MSG28_014256 [Choristoneura fumiferana]|uniref:Uncharacterized protein n=1 Tax=Choristoneura fumiferana TaxID=7141 RepID=A0ACC0JGL2_CHOFU|nr:hypothetical protein MSG28_014256 [Choristoneura fumiferana]